MSEMNAALLWGEREARHVRVLLFSSICARILVANKNTHYIYAALEIEQ